MPYYCENCYADIFPYHHLDNHEFSENVLTNQDLVTSSISVPQLRDGDTPNFYLTPSQCKTEYTDAKAFFLMHINTRSYTKNLNHVNEIIAELDKNRDIIAISETKLKDGTFSNVNIAGYDLICNNSKTNAGGVVLYIKCDFVFSLAADYAFRLANVEDLWSEISLRGMKRLVIGVIYRHPKSNFQEFQTAMENTIELLNSNSATYYITGDINIDLLKTDHDVKISHYFNALNSLGCSEVIAHPTRITATTSTLLDHIYTNNSSQHINSHAISLTFLIIYQSLFW